MLSAWSITGQLYALARKMPAAGCTMANTSMRITDAQLRQFATTTAFLVTSLLQDPAVFDLTTYRSDYRATPCGVFQRYVLRVQLSTLVPAWTIANRLRALRWLRLCRSCNCELALGKLSRCSRECNVGTFVSMALEASVPCFCADARESCRRRVATASPRAASHR
jgi:hypothetical protein